MLILARKRDERIIIGDGPDQIELLVIGIHGDKVRLGISAPKTTPVHRYEVWEAIRREREGLDPIPHPAT